MVGNGKGNGAFQTNARITVESPDIRNSLVTPYSTSFGNIVNGKVSGNVSYFNDAPPTGLALGPFPAGACVTITIDNYSNLNKVAVGTFSAIQKDLRASFTVNSTALAGGAPVVFNLCQCRDLASDLAACPTSIPLATVSSSEGFIEEAVKSLPVQIALGTVGGLLAVGVGVGLWCVIKKRSKSADSSSQYVKL